jgi:ribosomal-protein-alanine N-acetyltransferase
VQSSAEPNPDAYNWAITLKSTGQLIGWLGIGSPSHPTIPGERDFGYALNRDFWGNGYMPEALGAVLRFEFETLKTPRIYGECELENPASARVMEKVGMQYEGLFLDDDSDECHRYAIYPHQIDTSAAYSSFNSSPNK